MEIDEYDCAICLDKFKDPVRLLDCGHEFCRICLERHILVNIRCPLCRRYIRQGRIVSAPRPPGISEMIGRVPDSLRRYTIYNPLLYVICSMGLFAAVINSILLMALVVVFGMISNPIANRDVYARYQKIFQSGFCLIAWIYLALLIPQHIHLLLSISLLVLANFSYVILIAIND